MGRKNLPDYPANDKYSRETERDNERKRAQKRRQNKEKDRKRDYYDEDDDYE